MPDLQNIKMAESCKWRFIIIELIQCYLTSFTSSWTMIQQSCMTKVRTWSMTRHFSLLRAYRDMVCCPMLCGHLWSSCTTHLSMRCSWHRPQKPAEYCEWFPLGYHLSVRQNLMQYRCLSCSVILQQLTIRQMLTTLPHSYHRLTTSNWHFLRVGKKFMHAH